MKKSEIEKGLWECLHTEAEPDTEESGKKAVILTARQEYRASAGKRRISFGQFLTGQIKFMGWRVWGMQMASLSAVYLLFYIVCNGDFAYLWGKRLPVLLCFASVFFLFPALPVISRSIRFQMAEAEQVCRFSSNHLLVARLVLIGTGDILILALLVSVTVLGMGENPGVVALYLLVPFFLLGSIYITIAVHVDVRYVLKACLGAGAGSAVLLWLMYYFHHGFYEHSFQTQWAAVCGAAVLWDILQLRKAERKETAVETLI